MKIDVFGAVFLDRYIYKDDNNTEMIESIGGSGLAIALGLHILGHDVYFRGNIGKDVRQTKLLNKLKAYNFRLENIEIKEGETGLFVAENDKVLSVKRGVNAEDLDMNSDSLSGDYAVITTELNQTSIQKILDLKWEKIVLDVGPRPYILKDIQLPDNVIKIGNASENNIIPCDIVKLGTGGAKWGNITATGNNISLPYTIGAGDLFDTILIHGLMKGIEKEEILNSAVKFSEESCKIKGGFKLEKIKNILFQ